MSIGDARFEGGLIHVPPLLKELDQHPPMERVRQNREQAILMPPPA